MDKKTIQVLLAKPNVVSVGRGIKKIGGVSTGKPCIVVGVKKKLPLSALQVSDVIPLTVGNPPQPTDVIEVGEITLL